MSNEIVIGRVLVIFSNLFFLFPILEARHQIVHAIMTTFTMLISIFYHLCDTPIGVAQSPQYCILPFNALYFLDFTMSIMIVVNVMTYRIRHTWIREVLVLTTFCYMIAIYFSHDAFPMSWLAAYAGILLCVMLIYRLCYGLLPRRYCEAVLVVLLYAVAFFFFYLDTRYESDYNPFHSLWHLSSAIATWSVFHYFRSRERERHRSINDELHRGLLISH